MGKSEEKGEWKTIKGVHVFIHDGESATDALNRVIAKQNDDKKNEQIAKNKAMADKLNGKSSESKLDTALKNNSSVRETLMDFARANKKGDNDFIKTSLKLSGDIWDSSDRSQFAKDFSKYLKSNYSNLDYSVKVVNKKDGTWLNIKNNNNDGKYHPELDMYNKDDLIDMVYDIVELDDVGLDKEDAEHIINSYDLVKEFKKRNGDVEKFSSWIRSIY